MKCEVHNPEKGLKWVKPTKYLYKYGDQVYLGSGSEQIARDRPKELHQIARERFGPGKRIPIKFSATNMQSRLDSNERVAYFLRWGFGSLVFVIIGFVVCRRMQLMRGFGYSVAFGLAFTLYGFLAGGPRPIISQDTVFGDSDIYEFYTQIPEGIEQDNPTLHRTTVPLGLTVPEVIRVLGYPARVDDSNTSADGSVTVSFPYFSVTFQKGTDGIFRNSKFRRT